MDATAENPLAVSDAASWHDWLARHHASATARSAEDQVAVEGGSGRRKAARVGLRGHLCHPRELAPREGGIGEHQGQRGGRVGVRAQRPPTDVLIDLGRCASSRLRAFTTSR